VIIAGGGPTDQKDRGEIARGIDDAARRRLSIRLCRLPHRRAGSRGKSDRMLVAVGWWFRYDVAAIG
jgi:hypothetical protein